MNVAGMCDRPSYLFNVHLAILTMHVQCCEQMEPQNITLGLGMSPSGPNILPARAKGLMKSGVATYKSQDVSAFKLFYYLPPLNITLVTCRTVHIFTQVLGDNAFANSALSLGCRRMI